MITARDVMTPAAGYLDDAASIAAAAVMMREQAVSSIPICHDDGKLAGILTERDIVVRCLALGRDPYATPAGDLVDDGAGPVVVAADETLESALIKMAMHHVRRLPVVDHGSLVGMLADTDLARSLPDDSLGALFGQPPG